MERVFWLLDFPDSHETRSPATWDWSLTVFLPPLQLPWQSDWLPSTAVSSKLWNS